ncbi:MAG: hypothetical protein J5497_00545 [Selenomonadaceae bacterium]|nr:hypothetical protein [Selenomonadaceae bacterium]
MPATKFICPSGERIRITECLCSCPNKQRCMFLPTLRAVAKSLDRNISEPTVTELIAGVRETYLKKTSAYAVEPSSVLYALQGQAIHSINELNTQGEILSEERLKDDITSGQFDLYGKILDGDGGVLGDLKITSSFRLMRALGIYKVRIDTGEVYKSGLKKGQPKFRTELRYDGVRDLLDWSVQLNYYRLLLERAGFKISRMYIQAICRDASLRIAQERGIDKPVYIIPINKISDHWLTRYFQHKAKLLNEAIATKTLPPICSVRERWSNRKCLDYCAARENCPYAQRLLSKKEAITTEEFSLSA